MSRVRDMMPKMFDIIASIKDYIVEHEKRKSYADIIIVEEYRSYPLLMYTITVSPVDDFGRMILLLYDDAQNILYVSRSYIYRVWKYMRSRAIVTKLQPLTDELVSTIYELMRDKMKVIYRYDRLGDLPEGTSIMLSNVFA